jgi:putative membrane protein
LHERLSKLKGEASDREYVRQMVRDHDADVKEFEHQARAAADPDVKAWVTKTLPVIKEHQQQTRPLAANAKQGAGPAASPDTSGAGTSRPSR